MKRRALWIFLLVAAMAAAGYWLWQRQQSPTQAPAEVLRTAQISRGELAFNVAASGNVALDARYGLTFRIPGTVTSVDVQVGDRVERGQRLATLDDRALRDALQQVRLDLAQAELNLEQVQQPSDEEQIRLAESAIQESRQAMAAAEASEAAAVARAQVNQARAIDLAETATEAYETTLDEIARAGLPDYFGASAAAAATEAQSNVWITQLRGDYAVQQAQSQWQSAFERYLRASRTQQNLQAGAAADQVRNAELTLAQVALRLEQAEADLASTTLTAPTSGVIANITINVGGPATSAAPAMVLLDDSALYVDLTVDEIDIGQIREGQPAQLTFDAHPDSALSGTVERIGLLSQTATGSVAYPVRILIAETNGLDIRDGMTASALITTGLVENALRIPNWAVRTDAETNEFYTYQMVDGLPQRVSIRIGASNETWSEVLSGIEDGATVALVAESRNLPSFGPGGP